MRWRSLWKRGAIGFAPLILFFLLLGLLTPTPAQAQGGLALSGSFYRQEFEIPQGSSVSGPDIYVVVFNNGSGELGLRMTAQSPAGVRVTFSHGEFTLPAGGHQKVLIGVEVTKDAAPGDYKIAVSAQSYRKDAGGIQIAGAVAQTANLTVLGESASVKVQAVSPEGQPLVATIRLYRVTDGQNYEVGYSDSGSLEATVAPGDFIAVLYVGGEKRAEESFTVAADETKTISLAAATVYFEGFGLVPAYETESGKLAFVKVVYTVRNLYRPVDKAEVILRVTRDSAPLEEISLATLGPLDIGRASLNYNYIPAAGWASGEYGFTLELKLDGKSYATSPQERFTATVETAAKGGISPAVIGGIIAGVAVIVAGMVYFLVRKRRRA